VSLAAIPTLVDAVGSSFPSTVIEAGNFPAITDSFSFETLSAATKYIYDFGLSPDQMSSFETYVDFFSFLLLVRMAKLIGADRDAFIASKVGEICNKYPKVR